MGDLTINGCPVLRPPYKQLHTLKQLASGRFFLIWLGNKSTQSYGARQSPKTSVSNFLHIRGGGASIVE